MTGHLSIVRERSSDWTLLPIVRDRLSDWRPLLIVVMSRLLLVLRDNQNRFRNQISEQIALPV